MHGYPTKLSVAQVLILQTMMLVLKTLCGMALICHITLRYLFGQLYQSFGEA